MVSDAAKAARTAAEAAEAAQEPTHVHTYLLYVLGSAMGLKAACTMQRVLVYTREHHEHKAFFALARWEREEGRRGGRRGGGRRSAGLWRRNGKT